jgi:hypothetical protein
VTPDPAPPPAGPDPDALALAILADADRLYAASERYAGGREAFWEVEALAARVALLRLRADRDRLLEALRELCDAATGVGCGCLMLGPYLCADCQRHTAAAADRAAAALRESPP